VSIEDMKNARKIERELKQLASLERRYKKLLADESDEFIRSSLSQELESITKLRGILRDELEKLSQ
jgi:hypothetical protein